MVLVGGGVGVTPQIACLKDVFRIRMSVVARVDHARRGHIKHVYFVWAAPDRSHYMWFHDVFADCLKRHEEDPTYPELHLFCHLSRETEVPPGMPDHVFVGRPDIHAIMGIVCQERQEELKVSQGAVFACGVSGGGGCSAVEHSRILPPPPRAAKQVGQRCVGRMHGEMARVC